MIRRFRQYFKDAVCEWHCPRRKTSVHINGAETPPMFRRYSPPSYSRSRSGKLSECIDCRVGMSGPPTEIPTRDKDESVDCCRNGRRLFDRREAPPDGAEPNDAMLLLREGPAPPPPRFAQEMPPPPEAAATERGLLLPSHLLLCKPRPPGDAPAALPELAQEPLHPPD
ncbi:hypothetical protein C0J52_17358 [Blattella germanica]|nr:hypothetical protein C0J52_17358 [Blattella germanica]